MATRRLLAFVTAVTALGFAQPLSAQLQPEYTWTENRADGVAPVGVMGDRTYAQGELSLYYRFEGTAFEGQRVGEVEVQPSQVLGEFDVVPQREEVLTHIVGAAFGLSDRVTLELTVPLHVSKELDHVIRPGGEDSDLFLVEGSSEGWNIGDLEARGHLLVYEDGPYRAHATMGATVPIGSYTELYTISGTAANQILAPYSLQYGSGTVDLLPGMTLVAMNDRASTGIQFDAILRPFDNDRGYNLGHVFGGSVWGAYQFSDMVSFSGRLRVKTWMDVQGADPDLDPGFSPAANPFLQGGTRVELPLGLNVLFRNDFLENHRAGIEVSFPIYEDLHGPQLEHGWTLTLGWDYVLGGD